MDLTVLILVVLNASLLSAHLATLGSRSSIRSIDYVTFLLIFHCIVYVRLELRQLPYWIYVVLLDLNVLSLVWWIWTY